MRVLLHLPSKIACFAATEAQVARLAARLPRHSIVQVPDEAELVRRLPEAEAVVAWRFQERWYADAPRLRHVFTPAAGRERIHPDPRGVAELHFGHFHGPLMAESLLGMVLFLNHRTDAILANQRAHVWDPRVAEAARPLAGQIALIVGYGAIGRHVARLLSTVGMTVHGLRRDVRAGADGVARLFGPGELHAALALADHVVCVLPGDTGTDHLIDARAIASMKRGACVYNLGRGNAVDVGALAQALRAGALGGAFLDVWPEEPLPADSPLWDVPGLHVSPHASAVYRDYLDRFLDELAQALERLA